MTAPARTGLVRLDILAAATDAFDTARPVRDGAAVLLARAETTGESILLVFEPRSAPHMTIAREVRFGTFLLDPGVDPGPLRFEVSGSWDRITDRRGRNLRALAVRSSRPAGSAQAAEALEA